MADESPQTTSDVLDSKEIEQLVTPPTARPAPAGGVVTGAGAAAQPYDFRNPVFLAEAELRRIRQLQEDFVRYLSARLSLHLRMDVGLQMTGLTTTTYAKFTEALGNPSHISLFKIEPLVGVGVLDFSPRLALTIADRLLGGRGQAIKADRALTEIEVALIEDVILVILEEWGNQWKFQQALRPQVIGNETSARFLQSSPPDAIILALTLECTFGECTEKLQRGLPYYTVDPLVKELQARRQKEAAVTPAAKRIEWHASYDRVTVPVRAEWNAFEITLREVSTLRVGDVIEMQASICAETRVLLNGTPKFTGTVGLDNDHVAIQLTSKLASEESSHAKPDGRKVP
jgi:flagellar motor switch protein FliM